MCLTGYIFVSCNHYRSLDFLPAVFKLFPVSTACLRQSVCLFVCVHVCIALSLFTHVVQDYDFLVLTQPHASPEFPLLSHFTVSVTKPVSHTYNYGVSDHLSHLQRVPPHPKSTLPQELYVLHKCSLIQ